MKIAYLIAIAAVAAAILVLGWAASAPLGGTSSSNVAAAPPRPASEVSALADRSRIATRLQVANQAALQAEVAALRQEVRDLGNPSATADSPEDASLSGEEAAELNRMRVEARVAGFEHALDSEAVDGEWLAVVEDDIADTLAHSEFAGTALAGLRCGTTLCRAELTYATSDARRRAEELIPLRPPFATRGLFDRESPGDLAVNLYFARSGYELPSRSDEAL
ncbi:MAG: hypothetical protein AAGC55_09310 [Myxococcota bacterium]